MKTFFTKVFWVILIGGALYGAYVGYVHWWDDPGLKKLTGGFQQKITQTLNTESKKYADKAVESVKQSTGDYLKEKASVVIQSLSDSLQNSANALVSATSTVEKKGILISDIIPSGETLIPAPKGSTFFVPPPPATIITKINIPLVFSINQKITYTINWGDDKKESGTVTENTTRLLSHVWPMAGDYKISMNIQDGPKTDTTIFPVRVYE